jgi:hypothetical protein
MTTSTGYVTFSNFGVYGGTNVNPFSTATGATLLPSGGLMSFKARIPIQGWSNSAQIVGSFAGYTNVPGYQGNVDTFSVSYGTTNATTTCTASPCSYLDQIGNMVSQITRSSAGTYLMSFNKTYAKMKCTMNSWGSGGSIVSAPMTCSACNSLAVNTANLSVSSADSYGTIYCQGSY